MDDSEWMAQAACKDVQSPLWDANVPSPEVTTYCYRCPVRVDCAAYGLRRVYGSDAGVLGGLGLYDRQQVRSRKATLPQMWDFRLRELVMHDWNLALDEQMIREAQNA